MVNWKKLAKKIPHRIQVGKNKFYEVVWVKDFIDGCTYGETRFDKKQIAIKMDLTPKNKVITFLHECAHAFADETNGNLTENQILALEKSFYWLLKPGNIFKNE